MERRLHLALLATAIILIPAAVCVWWWFYWPTHQRQQHLASARRLLDSGDVAAAGDALSPLLKEQPNNAEVQLVHAQVLRRTGRIQEANSALHRAERLGLPEADITRERGLIEASGDFEFAEGILKKVLAADPADAEAEEALAEGYVRSQRWQDAERACSHLLELRPDRPEFRLARAQVRMELGRQDLATADLQDLLASSPRNFEARLLLAHCLLSNAHIAEAEKELEACRKLQPAHPGPLVGLASCALERGDLDQAQKHVQEALALAPNALMALQIQGTLYLRRQRYDLAIPVYEALVKMNPRDKEAHLKLAQALSRTGALEKAKQHQDAFEQLDREDAGRERLRRLGNPNGPSGRATPGPGTGAGSPPPR